MVYYLSYSSQIEHHYLNNQQSQILLENTDGIIRFGIFIDFFTRVFFKQFAEGIGRNGIRKNTP